MNRRVRLALFTPAAVAVAAVLFLLVTGCGSSGHQGRAGWLHRLAQQQARVFSESDPSRVSRVKVLVGSKDAIELWGRFACNGRNCAIGACPKSTPSFEKHRTGTCVIHFRFIKLAVDPKTHRVGRVRKLLGVNPVWVG
jgi:hypothetical protein